MVEAPGSLSRATVLQGQVTREPAARSPTHAASREDAAGGRPLDRKGRLACDGSAFRPANYADHISKIVSGPALRYVSNRIFNDIGQNLFSENEISQWGWAWGQFIDHDFGLRDERPGEDATMVFDKTDRLETFTNDFGALAFNRTPAAPGTGKVNTRQQINTITSFIDGSNVYGSDKTRLDWLREGTNDGNPSTTERGACSRRRGSCPG
jgi:Animal haem peroxidase